MTVKNLPHEVARNSSYKVTVTMFEMLWDCINLLSDIVLIYQVTTNYQSLLCSLECTDNHHNNIGGEIEIRVHRKYPVHKTFPLLLNRK